MAADLAQSIGRASKWLMSIQDNGGGWGEYDGAAPNVLNTAETILALIDSGECEAGAHVIQRGVHYLETAQLVGKHAPHAADSGSWGRQIVEEDKPARHLPDTVRSAFALLALNCAGKSPQDASIRHGLDWLLRIVNPDGGWGYAAKHESQLFPTCVVLRAMLQLHGAGDDSLKERLAEPITRGLAHLHQHYRNPDGSFGRAADLIVPHTLYALRTLLLARDKNFKVDRDAIGDAIAWVSLQGGGVTRWVNELIEIGPKKSGPYTFTHVTPALYLDTFSGQARATDAIARESMLVMHDNMDPVSCGMSGRRPVSWATAKALSGLAAVRGVIPTFPARNLPTGQVEPRHYLLAFLVLICGSATAVALADKMSNEYVGVMVLVVLAGLLIYGFISEQSFINALVAQFRRKQKATGE